MTTRPISEIAQDVRRTWVKKDGTPNVHPWAAPYLDAMDTLDDIGDRYFQDDADSIVRYFLSNATMFRGADARRIKAELQAML